MALKDAEIGVWYRKLFEASLIESQVKADTLRFEPAHERYNKLLQLHPEILKRAPLVYIASLLQMTPETLSRVRSANFCSYKKGMVLFRTKPFLLQSPFSYRKPDCLYMSGSIRIHRQGTGRISLSSYIPDLFVAR